MNAIELFTLDSIRLYSPSPRPDGKNKKSAMMRNEDRLNDKMSCLDCFCVGEKNLKKQKNKVAGMTQSPDQYIKFIKIVET